MLLSELKGKNNKFFDKLTAKKLLKNILKKFIKKTFKRKNQFSDISKMHLHILYILTLGLIGRDGGLSTLCYSSRFACQ